MADQALGGTVQSAPSNTFSAWFSHLNVSCAELLSSRGVVKHIDATRSCLEICPWGLGHSDTKDPTTLVDKREQTLISDNDSLRRYAASVHDSLCVCVTH